MRITKDTSDIDVWVHLESNYLDRFGEKTAQKMFKAMENGKIKQFYKNIKRYY